MITQFVCLNLLPAAIVKAGGVSLREPYIYVMYMNFIWLSIYLSVGLYVPNGIFTNVVLIYKAPSVVDCSFEDMFPVLFYIQQMLHGDTQTKKHVYQSLINNNFRYRITRFFTVSYFRVLPFILVGEVIFEEETFAYTWSIKKLTLEDEVLFSARLSGAQAAAETSIHVLNTQCVDMAQKYCFPFHPWDEHWAYHKSTRFELGTF